MYNFVSPEMPKAGATKTGVNITIVHFYIRRKLDIIRYDTRFFIVAENQISTNGY